jgi:hypothetical protein
MSFLWFSELMQIFGLQLGADPMQRSVSLSNLHHRQATVDPWKVNTAQNCASGQWLPQSFTRADDVVERHSKSLCCDPGLDTSFLTAKAPELGVASADFRMLDPYDSFLGISEGVQH